MKTHKQVILLLLITITTSSCASFKIAASRFQPAVIECYSGERLLYKGESTDRVIIEKEVYYFTDKKTGFLKAIKGDCILSYPPS